MKLKHLESALSSVDSSFPSPTITLEQYPTSPHLAASVLLTALQNDDVGENVSVCDLGCGTGMLTCAAGLVGCSTILSIDVDPEAILKARENVDNLELDDDVVVEFVLAEVRWDPAMSSSSMSNKSNDSSSSSSRRKCGGGGSSIKSGKNKRNADRQQRQRRKQQQQQSSSSSSSSSFFDGIPLPSKCVDTVITNPPFGTKHNAGIDIQFLKTACRLARRAVYSFHKTSTREYILKTMRQELEKDESNEGGGGGGVVEVEVVAQMKFDIGNVYKFHKKKSVNVEVDLVRVSWRYPEKEKEEEEGSEVERLGEGSTRETADEGSDDEGEVYEEDYIDFE